MDERVNALKGLLLLQSTNHAVHIIKNPQRFSIVKEKQSRANTDKKYRIKKLQMMNENELKEFRKRELKRV